MSDTLYIQLSNAVLEKEDGDWIRADVVLDGKVVATGFAPERPPYIDGTARSSAVSMALIKFQKILASDQRELTGFVEKKVKGAA